MMKIFSFHLGLAGGFLLLCSGVQAQSFSVDTTITPTTDSYSYTFTLNYDQAGAVQGLTDSIYDWTFYIDPSTPPPTAIALPTGWKYSYNQTSGQFDYYTEGANGFGSGDFGLEVLQPGQSLQGFGLTTPAVPDVSIAFATDKQFNQDATVATLPTSVPNPVPESSSALALGIGIAGLCLLAFRRAHRV